MIVSNPLGSGSFKFYETTNGVGPLQVKPAIIVSKDSSDNDRITPFELEKMTASVDAMPDAGGSIYQIKTLIEKSLIDE